MKLLAMVKVELDKDIRVIFRWKKNIQRFPVERLDYTFSDGHLQASARLQRFL